MSIEVHACTNLPEFHQAIGVIGQYFGAITQDRTDRFQKLLPVDRMHAAKEDGAIVGGAGAFPFTLSVPGAKLPCAGITVVGVAPTHRRRGILRAMMRAQLDDVHRRGEPIAALWASEDRIYGRFGYGLASLNIAIELSKHRAAFARPVPPGKLRLVEAAEALSLFPPIWERLREERGGVFSRTKEWWELRALFDTQETRANPKRFVVVENDGQVEGYAIYRHYPKFDGGLSAFRLAVVEAVGATQRATAQVWRYLFDIDWIETIASEFLPVDHALIQLMAEPRQLRMNMRDGLWVRLVDVPAALSQRKYASPEKIVFEVKDAFCPWNEGRYKLEDGVASRTQEEADIRCDATELGSVYLGGFTFHELASGGKIEEVKKGALSRADGIFRVDKKPWCPEIF